MVALSCTVDGVTFPEAWRPYVRTAADLQAIREGCYLDLAAAERVRTFFRELLRHSKGEFAGKPFELLPWQWERLILPAYGWKRPDGRRRFRKIYVEVPKKNGKSALCSGIAIYHVFEEPGAEVYLCACDRDQTKLVYDEAVAMVKASPELLAYLNPQRGYGRILHEDANAKIESLATDAASSEGKNASCQIYDELHAWEGREFYEAMMYAGRARRQPLIWQITTAGAHTTGICWEEHERALRVLAGEDLSTDFLPLVYAADPTDDWTDVETWKKANPSFGVTMDAFSIASDIQEAKGQPTKVAQLKRYGLNLWIGATTAWLDIPTFRAAQRKDRVAATFAATLARIAACEWRAGGIDLASTRDMASVVWGGEDEAGRTIYAERLFLPGDNLDERAREWKVPLRAWVEAGWIETTEGDVIDYEAIRARVVDDAKTVRPLQVGYDPWNAELLCNQTLRLRDGVPTISVPQTFSGMAAATREFELDLRAGKAEFSASPALAWQAQNAVTMGDSNENRRPVKGRSKGKIDGIVGAVIAKSRLLDRPKRPCQFYETNELETL